MPSFYQMSAPSLASAGGLGTQIGSAFIAVTADTSPLQRQLAAAKGLTGGAAQAIGRTSALMTAAGARLTRSVSLPLAAVGGVAIKMASDFETAMTRTAALAGIPNKNLEEMTQHVLDLSGQTAQAPAALADSLYLVASAGLRANEVLPVLAYSAKGAAAQLADAATLGDLLTSALNAFHGSGLTAKSVMDTLTAAIREGKAEPQDLASSLGTVIPVAAQIGVSFDEVAGAIAGVTNQGIEAHRAATALRYLLIQLQNPTEEGKKILDRYGLSIGQVQKAVADDGLIPTLKSLADTFDMSTARGKEAFITLLGGVRAGHVATALVGQDYKRIQEVMNETANAASGAGDQFEKAYQQMRATPQFQFQQAFNNLRLAAIDAGRVLLPIATQIITAIGNVGKAFSQLPAPMQTAIVQFGLLAASVGPVLWMFGSLGKLIAPVVSGLTKAYQIGAGAKIMAAEFNAAGGAFRSAAGQFTGGAVEGTAAAAGMEGAVSSLTGGILGTAATLGEWAAIAAGAVFAGGRLINSYQDLVTSNADLSTSTKLSVAQVSALRDQMDHTALVWNPFASQVDKVTEAGQRYANVLRDAQAAGVPLNDAVALLNNEFGVATEKIGGTTGSLDAFEQQLRSAIPQLHTMSPEIADLRKGMTDLFANVDTSGLQKSLDSAVAGAGGTTLDLPVNVTVQNPGDAVQQALQASSAEAQGVTMDIGFVPPTPPPPIPDSVINSWASYEKTVVDAQAHTTTTTTQYNDSIRKWAELINGAIEGGAKLADVVRIMADQARHGAISWDLFGAAVQQLGAKLPTADLGKWGDVLYRATGGSDEARRNMADMIRVANDLKAPISGAAQATIAWDLQNGNLSKALKTMTRELKGPVEQALKAHRKDISNAAAANVQAAIKAGDFRTAVKLLDKAVNAATGKHVVHVDTKLTNAQQLKEYKKSLDDIDRESHLEVSLHAAIAGGTGSIEGLKSNLGDISHIDPNVNIGTNAQRAGSEVTGFQTKINRLHGKDVKIGVTDDGTITAVKNGLASIPGTIPVHVVVTRYPHEGGIMHSGGEAMHQGGRAGRRLASDEVPAVLQRGEYVVNRRMTSRYRNLLDSINFLGKLPNEPRHRSADVQVLAASGRTPHREAGAPQVGHESRLALPRPTGPREATQRVRLLADTGPARRGLDAFRQVLGSLRGRKVPVVADDAGTITRVRASLEQIPSSVRVQVEAEEVRRRRPGVVQSDAQQIRRVTPRSQVGRRAQPDAILHSGGMVGPTHKRMKRSDEVSAVLQRGEYVVGRQMTARFRRVLDDINYRGRGPESHGHAGATAEDMGAAFASALRGIDFGGDVHVHIDSQEVSRVQRRKALLRRG